ncbi:helix-hairpin-helix domain-containing protein [Pantoea coffeiphila]|uniref:helix-hairpin-helix domain-containing protein n=1 Tax=Pantoea coffeiphila TaxID=1465635 RepID=UPI001961DC01|nr:helix-hairpin-helix domain-containing protein [Pantoea coffeiphila]MBM7342827.1 competence protein ComEA [Pantoea coffeiphila]
MFKSTLQALSLAFGMALITPALATGSVEAPKDVKAETRTGVKTPVPQGAGKSDEDAGSQVSINSATAQELAATLNGVGLKKAESIVSYRDKYGPFSQIDQLTEVPGIGKALVERNLTRIKL